MKTTTIMYHLLWTQFWSNFKVRDLWPIIITTTKTTTTILTTTTTFLGCYSIEINLVLFVLCEVHSKNKLLGYVKHMVNFHLKVWPFWPSDGLTQIFFSQQLLASSISIIMIYDSNTTIKYQNTKQIVP